MKIRSFLSLIVLVPLCFGVFLDFILQINYKNKSKAEHLFSLSQLIQKDISRLVFDSQQLLLTSDLLVSNGETYLIDSVDKKIDLLSEDLSILRFNEEESQYFLGMSHLQNSFFNFTSELRSLIPVISENTEVVHSLDLSVYDSLSKVLVAALEKTSKLAEENLSYHEAMLKRASDAVSRDFILGSGVFVLALMGTWFWAYFNISRPIQKLSDMTKETKGVKQLEELSVGPIEIKKLSRSFSFLANNLLYQANHDSLTGLYNRMAFNRLVSEVLEHSPDESRHALCFIDLDHFKIVNDSCGHAAGDALLKQVAEILTSTCRPSDIVARQGGDEFSILFLNCSAQKARYLTEKVRIGIKEHRFFWDNKKYHISSSFGISELFPKDKSLEESFNVADQACMLAKQTGRNCIVDYRDESIHVEKSSIDSVTFNDVKSALEENRFVLYRQSIFPSVSNQKVSRHFEILLRMKCPNDENKILGPANFMPVVERYRLFPDLDRWVVKNTMDWLSRHPDELENTDVCAINLSGNSICSTDVRQFIGSLFEEAPALGKKVCFEITETEAINDFEYAKALIRELKTYGCKFALDDFGSGLSSFSYLKNLDIDYVKIDGGFVRDMLEHNADTATVKAIVDVAKAFNKSTIAEFVETKEIANALRGMGVDYFQGYYYDRPSPLPE